MAEVDMCIPYMRAKAESKATIICQMTPNAIFVVAKELRILEVNPAAEAKFLCKQEKVSGGMLSSIINPQYFEEALVTRELVTGEVSYPAYGLVAWQAIFYVEKEEVIIGIFADITKEKLQRERLDRVTDETLEKAQEVIDKQMRVAQEIAGLLGETTAETKVQLTKLMKLIQSEAGKGK
jgi:nitrogen-specific signal transduction histidine kinase